MDYWSVDRMEEGLAVLEGPDQSLIRLEVSQLPPEVREGDCLFQCGSRWQIDEDETRRRRQEAARRLRDLWG